MVQVARGRRPVRKHQRLLWAWRAACATEGDDAGRERRVRRKKCKERERACNDEQVRERHRVVIDDPRWRGYLANLTPEEFRASYAERLPASIDGASFLAKYGGFTDTVTTIREDGVAMLTKNATWMKRWPSTRITIEGHCDERGTPEYNIALGDRRASAVKAYMAGLGIAGDRVVVVSKGKESPVCTDSNEACWQQNRRGTPTLTAK